MEITFFRSSSYNAYELCQMQYYLTYRLGWESPPNHKADKGSIFHAVMETLALCKKYTQLNKPLDLSPIKELPEGFGQNLTLKEIDRVKIDEILHYIYEAYVAKKRHVYAKKDYNEISGWIDNVLEFRGGIYNPLKLNIVEPESPFELEMKEDWAHYEYKLPDGQLLEGNLGLKGTIDLTLFHTPTLYEILDWKTGVLTDWKAKTKTMHTFASLSKSFQLHLYHYVLFELYPQLEQSVVTIYYVKHNEPFTFSFDRDNMAQTKEMIKTKFVEIQKNIKPIRRNDFFCSRVCHFGKTKHPVYPNETLCSEAYKKICSQGMEKTTLEKMRPNFKLGYYQPPGA